MYLLRGFVGTLARGFLDFLFRISEIIFVFLFLLENLFDVFVALISLPRFVC